MSKSFAVIGLGLFGRKVCEVLTEKGGEVIAIDNAPEQVNRVKDFVSQAILLDTTDDEAIDDAPLDNIDAAIVAIGDNIEASILTTTLLKQTGVPYIIARAVNRTHYRVLKKIGADEVINIEEDEGEIIANNLINPSLLKKINISGKYYISEIILPVIFIGVEKKSVKFTEKYNLRLIAVRRTVSTLDGDGNSIREESFINEDELETFEDADVLIVSGKESDIEKFSTISEVK